MPPIEATNPPRHLREVVTLPAGPASAALARASLRRLLTAADRLDCLDAAELACTELVTNAVLHAHSVVELTIEVGEELRVEVRDFSPSLPSQRGYDSQATTGRGLALIAALSDQHGITESGPSGKTVWFTLGSALRAPGAGTLALPAWEDGLWDLEGLAPRRSHLPVQDTRTVRLLNLPTALWLAAGQHHDGLLRELVLYLAQHPGLDVDLVATDVARSAVTSAVAAALSAADRRGTVRPAVPAGHPSRLPWVPGPIDLTFDLPVGLAGAFGAMQDALDAAERLAQDGSLLARPGLSEIVAVRDWACEQVVAQMAGVAPSPWPGSDQERFALEQDHAPAHPGTFDVSSVRDSVRGLVAADDANRIVAVSRGLAEATGWGLDELVGRRVVALVPPRLREAHVAGFTRHLTTGEAHALGVPLTLPVLCADGSELLCSFLIEQAPSSGGRALYLARIEPLEPAEPAEPAEPPEALEEAEAAEGVTAVENVDRRPGR